MKQFILVLICSCAALLSYSQTTDDEYNYVTKSYIDVVNKGADVKAGYTVETIYNVKVEKAKWNWEIKTLRKDGKARCLILVLVDSKGEADKVLCVPQAGSSDKLGKDYASAITKLGVGKEDVLLMLVSVLLLQKL